MVTTAPVRRVAYAVVALAFACPAVLLGGVAWADPTPAPAGDTAVQAPAPQPTVGSWIIGGTLLEGSAAQPAKPAAKPVAKPAAPTTTTRTSTRTATRTTSTRRTSTTSGSAGTAPDGATALPFTGSRADALLPAGIALVVGGVVLTLAGRPRRVLA